MLINKPKFAILLAACNGEAWIEDQLVSILNQSHISLDIFICIDWSKDSTFLIVKKLKNKYKNIHLLSYRNKFGSAAKNFFNLIKRVNLKKYNFIALSDQDDIWLPDKLYRAYQILNANEADAYSGNVIAFWPNNKERVVKKNQSQKKWDHLFEAAGPGCTYVINKKLMFHFQSYLKQNAKNTQFIESHDWFLYAFARSNNYNWAIDSYAGILYRQHDKNVIGVNSGFKAARLRLLKILSGFWVDQVRMIAKHCNSKEKDFIQTYLSKDNERYFSLAFLCFKCRRKFVDQIAFFVIFIMLGLKKFFISRH